MLVSKNLSLRLRETREFPFRMEFVMRLDTDLRNIDVLAASFARSGSGDEPDGGANLDTGAFDSAGGGGGSGGGDRDLRGGSKS